jgi:hypothetical protein
MSWTIPPLADETVVPPGARCQEATAFTTDRLYVPCGAPAVAVVRHPRDSRGYLMCRACASHNVRNRGFAVVAGSLE